MEETTRNLTLTFQNKNGKLNHMLSGSDITIPNKEEIFDNLIKDEKSPKSFKINEFAEKTAIGIITCNRTEMFKKCRASISNDVGNIYVFNAGTEAIPMFDYTATIHASGNKSNIPVGWAKNELVRSIRANTDNEFIFLIEDDVEIIDNKIFELYIKTAFKTGLWGCLSYGGHGNGNRSKEGEIEALESVKYDDDIIVDLYRNSLAAFTLFHRNIFREIGFFDERFINAAEHLDHYVEQYVKGIAPPFWYFPDIHESWKYIKDQDNNHEKSVIRKDDTFFRNGWEAFKKKRNMYPHQIPLVDREQVLEKLTEIEKTYGK